MSPDTRFAAAAGFERTGDFTSAAAEYISIINNNSADREAYIGLGSLYTRIDRLQDALECYLNAIEIKDDHVARFNAGSIYYKMGDYKKAVIHLEKSKKINPSFVLSGLVTGLCFSRLMNIKAAEINFYNVLKVVPSNRVALTALAIIYFNNKRFDDAVFLLDKLLQQKGDNKKIRELKSTALFHMGRYKESKDEYLHLSETSEGYVYFNEYIRSVPVDVFTDKYGSIEDKISMLTEKTDKDSTNLISLSLCHLFNGDTEKAIEYLFEARKNK